MKETVIETKGLSKSFGNLQVLQNVNLSVPKNSIFGFLGPNGAGKTTLIKILLGLSKPTSGSGTVFGYDIVKDSIEIRKKIGYLAQHPSYYNYMTAREVLRFKANLHYIIEVENIIDESLMLVGLEDKADRPIKKYSGGEMQRLGIAQAYVTKPELLILDEPAANLDPMGRRDVLEIMDALKQHSTVFYSTHILDDVQKVSDRVAILNQGKLVAQGPIENFLNGGSEIRYTVKLKKDPRLAYQLLRKQTWISTVDLKIGSPSVLNITVSDEVAAEERLLKLLVNETDNILTDFRRTEYELEDAFVKMVEAD
jgi:ABC-2 type transport system ATP-binding protein